MRQVYGTGKTFCPEPFGVQRGAARTDFFSEGSLWLKTGKWIAGELESGNREASEKATAIDQVREDGGFQNDGGSMGGEVNSLK